MIFKIKEIELGKLPLFTYLDERVVQTNLFLPWKKEIYDMSDLEYKLNKEGYNPEKYCYITVIYFSWFDKYWVMDGKHRLSILQKLHNKNKKIKVKIC